MTDFDSSDLEFSSPEDDVSRIGRKAMASILKQSAVDRVESKKTIKTLMDVANAPSTTYHRQYWYRLFMQFATVTLRIDSRPNKTPTPDDFVRFISRLPSHIESRHSDGKIAWTLIKNAEKQLDRALTFHYADYQLTRHDSLRVQAVIQKLLNDGEITRDPVQEKQWLTCQIVKKLVTAALSDAVQNGTKSWDTTVAGIFGLVLQAALSSRSGDFRRSAHYAGEEYLKWRDIDLVATMHDGQVTLRMLVRLFYRKEYKRDHSNVMSVELQQLDDEYSIVDPTKLCVAYALRIGLVEQTSWPDLMDAVLSRPNKRFKWTKPSSPVFYALTRNQHLDFANPAPIDQQRRFLCRAADLAGMLKTPVTHDIRRGAAADIFKLEGLDEDTNRVRRALGHSMETMNKGVTGKYIGRDRVDLWASRLNSDAPEDPFGVQMAPSSFKKRKIATADIDDYCDRKGLDKTTRKNRDTARRNLSRAQRDQWSTQQQTIADTVQLPTARPSLEGDPRRVPFRDITNKPLVGATAHAPIEKDFSLEDTDPFNCGLDLENIDPRLRGFANDVLAGQTTDTSRSDERDGVGSMADGCVALWESSQTYDEPAVLTATPDQFIGYLSTVNLVSVATDTFPEGVATGNSRDPPTRFLFRCKVEHCPRVFNSSLRRDQHEVNCRAESSAFLSDSVQQDDAVALSAKLTAGPQRKRKPQDISKASEGFPKPCPDSDTCGVFKDFATDHLLRNHRALHHDDNWPKDTPCNFPGCQLPQDHFFISREAFRRHLHSYHLLDAAQAREYVGKIIPVAFQAARGTSKSYLMTMCLFPGCKTDAEFANYSDYTGHLKKTHSLKVEQYPLYMPTLDTVRLHPRPQQADIMARVDREFVDGDPCSHTDCSMSTAVYATQRQLNYHLKNSHDIDKDEWRKYYTGVEVAPFYGTHCLHADCAGKRRFYPTEEKYNNHLKSKHNLKTVEEISSHQLWWKLKYH